ncbi:keratin, type I cytoskeletal 19-like isoform 2-T2 [Anomaloglossus baeobatrachus]|uniref:keratin, type I cytoskeletal 19-like isoform X2 n=1 Tax=Anomaloglossus baeobatrachus TaxID=238106 RepID=UPI003F505ADA
MPYGSRSALMTCRELSNPMSYPMSFRRFDALGLRSKLQDNGCRLSHVDTMTCRKVYSPNQKDVLIGLNSRLAAYLEKVKTLEESNHKLELQIQQVSKNRVVCRDNSHHWKTIAQLESQINSVKLTNSGLHLDIENTKLTVDGFKAKYDAELATRLTIEADMKKLKTSSDDLDLQKRCLEAELQILSNELENLRKDHIEEREHLLQQQMRCQVNVEVDTSEATQLTDDLDKLRHQYKELADHHQRIYEAWFDQKNKETIHQNIQTHVDPESLVRCRRQLSTLRRTVQELDVEHEVLLSLTSAQEGALYETISGYDNQLQNIQELVSKKEDELSKLKTEADRLASDSRLLCYLKDLLEMEIRTYALLMDDEENRIEDLLHEQPYDITNNRQKSTSVITKNPTVPDSSSGHPRRGERSQFLQSN